MGKHDQNKTDKQDHSAEASRYRDLLHELQALQRDLLTLEKESATTLAQVDARHRVSAVNLLHYLVLRRRDMRPLQEKLTVAGLSSLGRAESRVLSNLHAIITLLQHALGLPTQPCPTSAIFQSPEDTELLQANTSQLLGKPPKHRQVRIMVTLPGESADDYSLIKHLLQDGMDCARINCAHDDPVVWERMIKQIRHAQRETGRPCRILMDLGGPKLRTGEIEPGPTVVKWQPQRDAYGRLAAPARIWLYPEADALSCPAPADAYLPVQGDWLHQAKVLDKIELTDARGAKRKLKLVSQIENGFWAEASQTAYVTPNLELVLMRGADSGSPRQIADIGHIGALPHLFEPIRLQRGEHLTLTRTATPGRPAQFDDKGRKTKAATISCSLPEVFSSVKPGERLLIDDGRIGGIIRKANRNAIEIEITQARDGGEKLLPNKGINLPDSALKFDGLTQEDIAHLPFIAQHADMVGLSFVRNPIDIINLQQHLTLPEAKHLGVVLKIETRAAFECLPELLFTLMRFPTVGVMIARGDLAVECGYERLAELQEEIMWLAEAAHLPVIWATQVLEGLAKDGKPSRAEITDAAMSERAECVMLNKGPHIREAIQTLDDILQRMQGHQQKKSALLRRLHW